MFGSANHAHSQASSFAQSSSHGIHAGMHGGIHPALAAMGAHAGGMGGIHPSHLGMGLDDHLGYGMGSDLDAHMMAADLHGMHSMNGVHASAGTGHSMGFGTHASAGVGHSMGLGTHASAGVGHSMGLGHTHGAGIDAHLGGIGAHLGSGMLGKAAKFAAAAAAFGIAKHFTGATGAKGAMQNVLLGMGGLHAAQKFVGGINSRNSHLM